LKVEGIEHLREYRAKIPDSQGKETVSSTERHFCGTCGSHLWTYDKPWAHWIYPFAGAIDNDLPKAPHTVHMMLGSKASWVEPQVMADCGVLYCTFKIDS